MRRRRFSFPGLPSITLSAAIFIVALFVRLAPSGLYVTPDEPIWVHRSIQFLDALEARDWARIPQTGHPGITTMALGAAGVKIMQLLQPTTAAVHLDWIVRMAWLAPENADAFDHLSFFLPAGRALMAGVASLGLVLAYGLGRRGLGERAARWLALLLALDPFFAGHAGLLHTDALQATFVLLAVVLALPSAVKPSAKTATRVAATPSERGKPSRAAWTRAMARWDGVALCLALAGLTKTLGLLVAPGLALAMLVWGSGSWLRRVLRVGLVAALSLGFLLALTPTFFATPQAALAVLFQAVSYHEGIGLRDVFFAGEMRVDPGPLFYPVVLVFRLTPPVLLGLFAVVPRRKSAHPVPWRTVATAGLPALGYVLALTLATKKFDRYVLSAVPLLALIATLSLAQLRRCWRRALVALLLLPWAAVAVVPLHYATPLLGGPWIAQDVVPLGWGEASGLAAGRLNGLLPEPQAASLLTGNVPGTAGRFAGTTRAYDDRLVGCTEAIISGIGQSYPGYVAREDIEVGGRQLATLFVSEAALQAGASDQAQMSLVVPGPLPGMQGQAAAPVTTTAGLELWLNNRVGTSVPFLWLQAPDCYPATDAQLAALLDEAQAAGDIVCRPTEPVGGFTASQCVLRTALATSPTIAARFAGALDLVAVTWNKTVDRAEPLAVRLRLQPLVQLGEVDVYLVLQTGEGVHRIVWAEGGQRLVNDWTWPAPQWPVGEIADATAYIWVPHHMPPGTYDLVMMLSGTQGWLSLVEGDGAFGGIMLRLGDVEVPGRASAAASLEVTPSPDPAWPGLRVVGIEPPEPQITAGRSLHASIGVERVAGTPPAALSWMLVCDGEVRQEGAAPWEPGDPVSWSLGERYKIAYALRVDTSLPEGLCRVVMRLPPGDPASGADGPGDDGNLVLGDVVIAQRSRQFALPRDPARVLNVDVAAFESAGNFAQLVGGDVEDATVRPGQAVDVTLYWRALAPAMVDYTAFVHLAGSDGRIWAQSDQMPAGGEAPTVTWSPGEVIVDRHRVHLPPDIEPGRYTLSAGLYNAEHGDRATLTIGGVRLDGDSVAVGELTVAP